MTSGIRRACEMGDARANGEPKKYSRGAPPSPPGGRGARTPLIGTEVLPHDPDVP